MSEKTDTDMAQADNIAIAVARGRAKYLRDRREVKTPQIIERLLEIIAAHESRAQPASDPDWRARLAALESRLRERGVVDVKFDFAKTDAPLSTVANDVADVLEAVLDRHTKKFDGLGDSPAQPASVVDIPSVDDDLRDYGIGFEVDGKRVAPARVRVFKAAPQPPAKDSA